MKKIILLFLPLYFTLSLSYAQNCLPNSLISLESSKISLRDIQNSINLSSKKNYKEYELETVKQQIDLCTKEMAGRVNLIEDDIKKMSALKKELQPYLKAEGLKTQLEEQNNAKLKIKEELKKDFARIERKGLFAILMKNLPENPSTEVWKNNGRQILLPRAIEYLNGTNIKRITQIDDYSKVKDVIESFTTGSFKEIRNYGKPNYSRNSFLYIVEASVSPVSESVLKNDEVKQFKSMVINLETETNYASLLQAQGIAEQEIKELQGIVNSKMPYILSDNKRSESQQNDYLFAANQEIKKIDERIKEINRKIIERNDIIKKICTSIGVKYNFDNPTASANQAASKIEEIISQNTQKWTNEKENEIAYEITPMPFPIEENPLHDVSQKAMELYKKINIDKGLIKGLEIYTKIEDLQVTESNFKTSTDIYRKVDKIWIYPIPQDNSSYRVAVFAKFKITTEKVLSDAEIEQKTIKQKEEKLKDEREKKEKEIAYTIQKGKDIKKGIRKKNWKEFTSKINVANIQYHYNRNYNLIDLGPRWAEIDEDAGGVGTGVSLGWYWKKANATGVCLTGNLGLAFEWFYAGIDLKAGIGKGSFLAFQPKIGLGVKGVIYCSLGYEFATGSRPCFGLQAGFNIPIRN
jgi:hypothetical protein